MNSRDFVPPRGVQETAKEGLRWFSRGYVKGTLVSSDISFARALASGEMLKYSTIRDLHEWFSSVKPLAKSDPYSAITSDEVLWKLHGGPEAAKWAEKTVQKMNRSGV